MISVHFANGRRLKRRKWLCLLIDKDSKSNDLRTKLGNDNEWNGNECIVSRNVDICMKMLSRGISTRIKSMRTNRRQWTEENGISPWFAVIFINYIISNPISKAHNSRCHIKHEPHVNSCSLNIPKQIWHIFVSDRNMKKMPRWYFIVIWNAHGWLSHRWHMLTHQHLRPQWHTDIKIRQIHCRLQPLIIARDSVLNIIWFVDQRLSLSLSRSLSLFLLFR